MKLNHECVRDILLTVENKLVVGTYIKGLAAFDELKYSDNDKFYSIQKLIEARYLEGNASLFLGSTPEHPNYNIFIKSITYYGHQFLNNIRDDGTWKKTISTIGSKTKSVSIEIISQVASNILRSSLGLQ